MKSVSSQATDLVMLSNPQLWPYEVLPLKKGTSIYDYVLAFVHPSNLLRVYLGGIGDLDGTCSLASFEHVDYTSSGAILEDGWEVD